MARSQTTPGQRVRRAFEHFGRYSERGVDKCLDHIFAAFARSTVADLRRARDELHAHGVFLEASFCDNLLRAIEQEGMGKPGKMITHQWLMRKTLEITSWAPPEYAQEYLRKKYKR